MKAATAFYTPPELIAIFGFLTVGMGAQLYTGTEHIRHVAQGERVALRPVVSCRRPPPPSLLQLAALRSLWVLLISLRRIENARLG